VSLHLVWRNLLNHWVRSLLTLLSIAVATFLICMLRTIVTGLDAGVEAASSSRLVVQSAVSLFVNLPMSYQTKISGVEGVEHICKWQWFGGYYQEKSNRFAQFGVDAEKMFPLYPEIRISDGSKEEFVARRDSCMIGRSLAEKFEWKVGDTIPLKGTIFRRVGGAAWEFEVAAIYESDSPNLDPKTMFFHFDNLKESLESGAATGPQGVGVYVIGLSPGARPETVMQNVDAFFENGPQRVQATTEAEFQRQFVSMLGNIPTFLASIGGGVFFAILLAALNTMLMAARERTRDLGIMKAMGFNNRSVFTLLLVESLVLCGMGGTLGVLLAKGAEPGFRAFFGAFMPGFSIPGSTVLLGLGAALAVGIAAGILPAWRASRLIAVEALREV